MARNVIQDHPNVQLIEESGKLEGRVLSVESTTEELRLVKTKGSRLTVRVGEKDESLFFPHSFSPPEVNAVLQQNIKYSLKKTYFSDKLGSGEDFAYSFEVLDGPYKGWKVDKSVNL